MKRWIFRVGGRMLAVLVVLAAACAPAPSSMIDGAVVAAVRETANYRLEPHGGGVAIDTTGLPAGVTGATLAAGSGLRAETITYECDDAGVCRVDPPNSQVFLEVGAVQTLGGDTVEVEVWLHDFRGPPASVTYLTKLIPDGEGGWRVVSSQLDSEV